MSRRPSRQRQTATLDDLRGQRLRAYVRESTERQAGPDHYGPDIQRAGIERFCHQHGLTQPEFEYFDASSGRSTARRNGLQRALEDAADYDVLLIFHSSRSFRNRMDAVVWKQRFARAGITIVFTEQSIISGNPQSKIVEGFHELIDEQRSDEQGMFIARGLRAKFERGLHNGTAPLGYQRYIGRPGDPRNGELVIDAPGARTVRAIYEGYLARSVSYSQLTTALNASGHLNARGLPLSKGTVEDILRNPVYTGVVIWHPGTPEAEYRPGKHEPIVTDEEYAQVQAIRASRTHAAGRKPTRGRVYPLSPVASCHECGASFKGDTSGSGGHRRYRHRDDRPCTNRRSFAAERIEEQLGEVILRRLDIEPGWEAEAMTLLANPARDEQAAERSRIEAAIESLRRQHTWGDIDDTTYRLERQALTRELQRLQPASVLHDMDALREAAQLLANLESWWKGVDAESRRDLVTELFTDVAIDGVGVRSVQLRDPYSAAIAGDSAIAYTDTGFGRGDWSLRRNSPPAEYPPRWSVDRVEITGVRVRIELRERLA